MTPQLHPDLVTLADALRIDSDGSVWLSGKSIGPAGADQPCANGLADALYREWYCRPRPVPDQGELAGALTDVIVQANAGTDGWDTGWTIYKVFHDGVVEVTKGQRTRRALPGNYIFRNPGAGPQEGATVDLFLPSDNRSLMHGYYFVFGNTLDECEAIDTVRFYFALDPHEAPLLVRWLTEALATFAVPFRFKCLDDPTLFDRADTAVLYVPRCFVHIVTLLLMNGWRMGPRAMPAMTRPVVPGVSLAEDPPNGESFGAHRCGIIAAALMDAHRAGRPPCSDTLRDALINAGLDPIRPWLNHGSVDFDLQSVLSVPDVTSVIHDDVPTTIG